MSVDHRRHNVIFPYMTSLQHVSQRAVRQLKIQERSIDRKDSNKLLYNYILGDYLMFVGSSHGLVAVAIMVDLYTVSRGFKSQKSQRW